jgi:hypothetical protein
MIRVFPRKTRWTPDDALAFVGDPPPFRPASTEVYVSVAFTWDIREGERLQRAWQQYYPRVHLGGPALDTPASDFIPGRFLKGGVTITSRGCPHKCPWCFVPKREGKIVELPIRDGWIIQDNNLLACSRKHIEAVFEMLQGQKERIKFSGGLDPRLLKKWHVELLKTIRIDEVWISCDEPKMLTWVERAADLLSFLPKKRRRCHVLIGWNGESMDDAEERLERILGIGFLPFAQLYQGPAENHWSLDWKRFQRRWDRPAVYRSLSKERHAHS